MANKDSHYAYSPSLPAAVIFIILFAAATAYHTFLLFRNRTWFCVPFVIGGLFEAVGYVGRAIGHGNPAALGPYIIQSLLILLAPIFFAASVYMVLGRIMRRAKAEAYSMIRVTWLTKLFVGGDILSFLTQALGGGMLAGANTASQISRGQDIILAGLILQIVIFGFFVVVALVFHKRLRQRPTPTVDKGSFRWERFMLMLYVVSALITLRNLFRVIEYAIGKDGYLLQNEWPIYVMDAFPMAIVLSICVKWYERDISPRRDAVNLETVEQG